MSSRRGEWNGTRILFSMLLGNNVDRVAQRNVLTVAYRPLAPFAFFDESGKWKNDDFICLCGYLSGEEQWDHFTTEWRQLLDQKGLHSMHLTKYFREVKILGWDNHRITKTLEEFVDIIRRRIWVGFAIGFDAKHYRAMPSHVREVIGDPGLKCVQRLLVQIRERFHKDDYQGRMAIAFDEDYKYVKKTYTLIQQLRHQDVILGKLIGSVAFADDEFVLALQAADILANLTNRWFHDRMVGKASEDAPPEMLKRLLMGPGRHEGVVYCTELWDSEVLDRDWRRLAPQKQTS
jgi:hypothetical protein